MENIAADLAPASEPAPSLADLDVTAAAEIPPGTVIRAVDPGLESQVKGEVSNLLYLLANGRPTGIFLVVTMDGASAHIAAHSLPGQPFELLAWTELLRDRIKAALLAGG